MAESLYDDDETASSSQIQPSSSTEVSSALNSGVCVSALSRLKVQISGLWFGMIRRWPVVLPLACEFFILVLRTNLMFFYFEGLYYHLTKRAAEIHYVFIGKPTNQRPRYQILGGFLLVQLCIIATKGLRKTNLSSFAASFQQTSLGAYQTCAGRGLPVLTEEGNLVTEGSGKSCWVSESTSTSEVGIPCSVRNLYQVASAFSKGCNQVSSQWSEQMHALPEQSPTPDSHTLWSCVFCWYEPNHSICVCDTCLFCLLRYYGNCVMEWCNEKPECPLCRSPVTHSSRVSLHHSDFLTRLRSRAP